MTAHFWRVLDRLGAAGSAARDWQTSLGDVWEEVRGLLRVDPGTADAVIDPDDPDRPLLVVPDGETGYLGIAEDEPLCEPLPLTADEVTILRPDWAAIAEKLGAQLGFVAGAWETAGHTRQIGIAQHGSNLPRPVILHLPAGHFGDMTEMLRDLSRRENAIVLLPSVTWLNPDVQGLQGRNHLEIITLAEVFEAAEAGQPQFPIATAMPSATSTPAKRRPPALHPQPGWRWDMVRIVVATAGRLIFSCDGQRKEFRFPKSNRKTHSKGYEIMMRLAVHQEWRNPPSEAPGHDRLRRQFYRLGELLADLVPLPGPAFRKEQRRFIPEFQVALHPDLASRAAPGR